MKVKIRVRQVVTRDYGVFEVEDEEHDIVDYGRDMIGYRDCDEYIEDMIEYFKEGKRVVVIP